MHSVFFPGSRLIIIRSIRRLTSKNPFPCSSTAKPSLPVSSHFSTSLFLSFPMGSTTETPSFSLSWTQLILAEQSVLTSEYFSQHSLERPERFNMAWKKAFEISSSRTISRKMLFSPDKPLLFQNRSPLPEHNSLLTHSQAA